MYVQAPPARRSVTGAIVGRTSSSEYINAGNGRFQRIKTTRVQTSFGDAKQLAADCTGSFVSSKCQFPTPFPNNDVM